VPMTPKKEYFALIADYRNAAVLQKRGTQRMVWEGKEYFTDGKTYVGWKTEKEKGFFVFDEELHAKEFIDAHRDHIESISENSRMPLMTFREAFYELHQRPMLGDVPNFIFDETHKVFIRL